ncbi:MAG: hypothetical protein MUF62_06045 [Chitinophagaceae bacterium]|nr:hypothetical protein [Chitinophagaceae bacterium]
MLDNLLQLVKDFGENEVVNNPAIPNEHNNAVMSEAGMAVAGTLQQALASGNVQEVLAMFQQGDADVMSNPLAQQAQGSFMDSITSKLGIDKGAAAGVAGSLLPMIMNALVKRTNSQAPEDSGFDLSSLIGSLTGGGQPGGQGGLDIGGLINQFTGQGGQGGAGGFDLNNIINQVKGGGNQGGGGGLGDLIQGFFGK